MGVGTHRRRGRRTPGSPPSPRGRRRARTREDNFPNRSGVTSRDAPSRLTCEKTAGRPRIRSRSAVARASESWPGSTHLRGRPRLVDRGAPFTAGARRGRRGDAPNATGRSDRPHRRRARTAAADPGDLRGNMGTSSSKSKRAKAAKRAQDQVTEVDRQVLGLKTQKRKLNAYAKRVEVRGGPGTRASRTDRARRRDQKLTQSRPHPKPSTGGHRAGDVQGSRARQVSRHEGQGAQRAASA